MTISKLGTSIKPLADLSEVKSTSTSNTMVKPLRPELTELLARLISNQLQRNNVTVSHGTSALTSSRVNATAVAGVKGNRQRLEKVYQSAVSTLMGTVTGVAVKKSSRPVSTDVKSPFGKNVKALSERAGKVATKSCGNLPDAAVAQLLQVDKLGISRDTFVSFLVAFDLAREVKVPFSKKEEGEMHSLFGAVVELLQKSTRAASAKEINKRVATALATLTDRLGTQLSRTTKTS